MNQTPTNKLIPYKSFIYSNGGLDESSPYKKNLAPAEYKSFL